MRLLAVESEYSAADIAAMRRLYGVTANLEADAVTNPPGIPLKVDLGFSETTLDFPRNAAGQAVYNRSGTLWLFARWSDVVDGDPVRFADPRRTVRNGPQTYIANFVRLVPIGKNGIFSRTTLQPAGAGSIAVLHAPTIVDSKAYRVADALVTIQAKPAAGYQFYGWNTPWSDPGNDIRRVNPDSFTRPEALFAKRITARIETVPPGLFVQVDEKEFRGNKNFAAPEGSLSFDGESWKEGSVHKLRIAARQPAQVEDPNAILRFQSWTSSGPADSLLKLDQRETQFLANGQTIVARYVHAYPVIAVANTHPENCAIQGIATDPPADNGFYNEGTKITAQLSPLPGWRFLGWTGDTGTVVVNGSTRLKAIVNTNAEPLALRPLETAQIRRVVERHRAILRCTDRGFSRKASDLASACDHEPPTQLSN